MNGAKFSLAALARMCFWVLPYENHGHLDHPLRLLVAYDPPGVDFPEVCSMIELHFTLQP